MNMQIFLILTIALQVKHFVVDFLLQTEYQWKNKGNFGHPGGILHSALHAVVTMVILCTTFNTVNDWFVYIAIMEFCLHYLIDWAKMNLNRIKGWTADTEEFWWLLGLDQLLHQLTYIAIIGGSIYAAQIG